MSVLITGASGSLGREFARIMPDALTPSSADLDVRDLEAVAAYVRDLQVGTVVHCAAMTSVVDCENDKKAAFETNVTGTSSVCQALAQSASQTTLVYISTACVFPGDDPAASYTENDLPHPKNYYALTKLLAEYVVAGWASCSDSRRALVVRTNFADRGPWKHSRAFVDRFGTYLYPDQIAPRVVELMGSGARGVVHVCGQRRLSMYEFARLSDASVGSIRLCEYTGPPLTVNMCLGSSRIRPINLT